jgi:N-acetylglucosamine kinase-like BadF-type ATPase
MENSLYICVDAGGTKSKAALFDDFGAMLKSSVTGPGSPAAVQDAAWKNIEEAIWSLFPEHEIPTNVKAIQMGVSGAGVVKNIHEIEAMFTKKFGVPCSIQNDAIEGLYSIVKDQYKSGILVLAGTGSAIYGVSHEKTILIGGWGHIIRERGSAYAAVHQTCLRIIDKYENSMTLSDFDHKFMEHLGIQEVNDFKKIFYGKSKDEIAKNVVFIKDQASQGDPDAMDILIEEGKALGEQVRKLAEKLDLDSSSVIGLRGSFILKQAEFIQQGLFSYLENLGYNFHYIEKEEDPIVGSFYLAKINFK